MRAAIICLLVALPLSASDVVTKYETVKVGDGIYAFITPEPKSGVVNGNSVAIIGDDGVLVVDTGQIPTLTRRMIGEIRAKTDKPVRYVVNTHWHWDHNICNAQYREAYPNVSIVSTPFTRQLLIDSTPKFLEFFHTGADKVVERGKKMLETKLSDTDRADLLDDLDDFEAGIPELRTATFVAPDTVFDTSMTVFLGKREVRIFTPGRANTAGDAVVYVPDAKVLVTGDIVVSPTPYATSSHFVDWIASLKKLSAMDVAVIVPGHGPVQRDRSYMTLLTQLLESLVSQVGSAVQQGLTLEETQKRVDLESFRKQLAGDDRRRNRAFREYFLTSAIATAYKQAKGEPTTEGPFGS